MSCHCRGRCERCSPYSWAYGGRASSRPRPRPRPLAGTTPGAPGCGEKYKGLISNNIGGTLDEVCRGGITGNLYCNSADVRAWLVSAEQMWIRLRARWNEVATARGGYMPQRLIDYVGQLEREYCEADADGRCVRVLFPQGTNNPLDLNANMVAATTIVRWMARAACALEMMDEVGPATPGGPRPPPPPPIELPSAPPSPWENAGGVAGNFVSGLFSGIAPAVAVVALLWWFMRNQNRAPERED